MSVAGRPSLGRAESARGRNLARASELVSPDPQPCLLARSGCGSQDPATATRRGFLLCIDRSRSGKPTTPRGGSGSRRHDLHACGTARVNGRLFRHETSYRIPAICAGMPPAGARGQDRAASRDYGGNGAGLGDARQGDRPGRRSRLALTACFLRVWEVPLTCQTKPNLRHVQQSGPRFRVMERARHLQALGGVTSILVGSPHRAPSADLAQRRSAPDVPGANGFLGDFHPP